MKLCNTRLCICRRNAIAERGFVGHSEGTACARTCASDVVYDLLTNRFAYTGNEALELQTIPIMTTTSRNFMLAMMQSNSADDALSPDQSLDRAR
jgi:hypothetical protein